MDWVLNLAIVVGVVAVMEAVANLSHKYIMHGIGWAWHESHHTAHDETFERNDLYAVVFAIPSMLLIYLGVTYESLILWVGVGMTAYGFLYFFVHDGLVHNRWPWRVVPHGAYMRRLVQAHRMHHAVHGREGCVSFGFLYAKDVRALKEELRVRHGGKFSGDDAAR